MSYANLLVLSFFDMLMLISIILSFKVFLNKKDIFNGIMCLVFGTLVIGSSGYFITNEPISITFNIIIAFLIILFITKQKLREVLILYIFSLTIMYSIQFLVTIIYKLALNNFVYSFKYGLISQITALTVIIVMLLVVPIRGVYLYITERNKWFEMITINIFVIYYVLLMLWYTNLNSFLETIVGILVLVVSILALNAIILNNGLKNQLTHEKINIYDTYLPIIEDIIEEIRVKQHDYHNHIQALESIQLGDLINLNGCIQDYKEQLIKEDIWSKLIRMDNKILIALLYSKHINALSLGIYIDYVIDNYLLKTRCTDYELVEIFGILIDNAFEAVQGINEASIKVVIGYENGMNVIDIRNKSYEVTSDEIKRMFEYNYTTKKINGHGIGLYKLQKLLNKKNGTITAYYDTDEKEMLFTVRFI